MNDKASKTEAPPYVSYASFRNFIKGLKETGVPARIDKSIMTTMAGSTQYALITALKWLRLTDDGGMPTARLDELVAADDKEYNSVLKQVVTERYSFVNDASFPLGKATGSQVEGKFREYGIEGSTVTRSMAFFILACKDAGIGLGPHVKAPKPPKSNGSRKAKKKVQPARGSGESEDELPTDPPIDEFEGMERIPVPLKDMEDGAIFFPKGLDKEQAKRAVKMAVFILNNFYGIDD